MFTSIKIVLRLTQVHHLRRYRQRCECLPLPPASCALPRPKQQREFEYLQSFMHALSDIHYDTGSSYSHDVFCHAPLHSQRQCHAEYSACLQGIRVTWRPAASSPQCTQRATRIHLRPQRRSNQQQEPSRRRYAATSRPAGTTSMALSLLI